MPNKASVPKSNSGKRNKGRVIPVRNKPYFCRVCKRPHPLRTCKKFLDMDKGERLETVEKLNYCKNCLAHEHSHGSCFSKRGCRHCHKRHHTLLHVDSRVSDDKEDQRGRASAASSSRANPTNTPEHTTLTAMMRQNSTVLLPTVLVRIRGNTAKSLVRCLLDSGSPISCITKKVVDVLKLTTLTLGDEIICPLVLRSRFDADSKVEAMLRVDNRIAMKTPTKSLPESFKKNFPNLFLADSKFYESAPIDLILGVDLYPKIVCDGSFSKPGLPTALNTIFGWAIYGTCAT